MAFILITLGFFKSAVSEGTSFNKQPLFNVIMVQQTYVYDILRREIKNLLQGTRINLDGFEKRRKLLNSKSM